MSRRRLIGRASAQADSDFQKAIEPQYTQSMPPPMMDQMNAQKIGTPQPVQVKQEVQQPPPQVFFQPTAQASDQNVNEQQQITSGTVPQIQEPGVFDLFKPQESTSVPFNPPQVVPQQPQQSGFGLFGRKSAKSQPTTEQNILAQTGAPLTTPATQLSDNMINMKPFDPPVVTPSQPIQQLQTIKQEQDALNQQHEIKNDLQHTSTMQYVPVPEVSGFFNQPASNAQQNQLQMEEAIPQATRHDNAPETFSDSNLDHLGTNKVKNHQDSQTNILAIASNKQQILSKESTELADQQSSITQSYNNLPPLNLINHDQKSQHSKSQNCSMCGQPSEGIICQNCYKQITDENQTLKNQVSDLNKKVTYFEMENTGIQEQYDALYPQYQQTEHELQSVKNQLEALTEENQRLKKQSLTTKDNISTQQFNQQKLEYNKEIQKKNEQIQKLIIEQQNKEQQYSSQQQQMEELQEQLRRYSQTNGTIEKLQANLAVKSEEAVQLQYQIQNSNSKILKLEQQINDYVNQIKTIKQESADKDEQFKQMEIEKENIKKEIDSIQMQFDEQIDLNEKNLAQISKYEAQLSENRSQISNIQRTQQENMQLKKELLELQRNKFQNLPQVSRSERVSHFATELSLKRTEFPLTSMNEHLLLQDLQDMMAAERNNRQMKDQEIKNRGESMRQLNLPSHLELITQLLQTKLDPSNIRPLIRNLLTGIFDQFEGKTPKSEIIIQIQLYLFSGELPQAIALAKDNNMHDLVYYLLTRDEQDEDLKDQHSSYVNFMRISNGFEHFECSPRQLLTKFIQDGSTSGLSSTETSKSMSSALNNGYYEIGLGLSCVLLGESNIGEFLDMIGNRYVLWGASERQFAAVCIGFPLLARSGFEYIELNAADVAFRLKQRFIPRAVRHLGSQFRMPLPTNWIASLIYQYITGRMQALQQLHSVKLSNKVCTQEQSPSRSTSMERSICMNRKDDILSYDNINSAPEAVNRLFAELSKLFINTYNANENDLQGDLCDISCLAHVQHTKKPSDKSTAQQSASPNQQKSLQQQKGWDVEESSSSSTEGTNDTYSDSYSSSATQGDWIEELQQFNAPEKLKFESFLPDSYYQLRGWPHLILYDVAICVWLGKQSGSSEERLYSWMALQLARKAVDQIVHTVGAASTAKCDESLLVREFPFGLSARDCLFAQTPRAAGLFGDVRNRLDTFLGRLGDEPVGVDTHKLKRFADAFYNENQVDVHKMQSYEHQSAVQNPKYQQSSILATSDVKLNGAISPQIQQYEKCPDHSQESIVTQTTIPPQVQQYAVPIPPSVMQIPKSTEQLQNQTAVPVLNHKTQLFEQNATLVKQEPPNAEQQYFPPQIISQPPSSQPGKIIQDEEDPGLGLESTQQVDLLHDPLPNIETQSDKTKTTSAQEQQSAHIPAPIPAPIPMPMPLPLSTISPPQVGGTGGRNQRRRQLTGNQSENIKQPPTQPYIPAQPTIFVPEITNNVIETPEPQMPDFYEKEQSSSSSFNNNQPEEAYDINNLMKVNESTRLKDQMYEVPKQQNKNTEQQKQQKVKEKKAKDKKEKLQPAQGKKLSRKYSEKYKQWVSVDKDGNEIPPENTEQIAPPPMAPGFG